MMKDLDPLELLEHTGRLGELTDTVMTEDDPLAKLDGIEEMTGIFDKLGVGGETPDVPKPDLPEPEGDGPPAIVLEFLNGSLDTQSSSEFIDTLRILEDYMDTFITFDQIVEGAERWWATTGVNEVA